MTRTAVVTGASRGIGQGIAARLNADGWRVVNLDVTPPGNGEDASARWIETDLADPASLAAAFDIIAKDDPVTGLVNNAGIFTAVPIEDTTEEIWDSQIDLNMKGSFFMAKAVVPGMKAKGRGKIINVTSIAGVGGFPNSGAYCSSKGGQLNMVKALCLELAEFGINVNSLAPGNIETDMNAPYRAEPGYDERQKSLTPARIGHLDPNDLTGAAVFFASADSDLVHGANLLVDGGWAAW